MGVFSLVFQVGSMSEPTDEEAKEFLKEFETLVEDIDSIGIFLHNTSLALPMFIPGFGVAWGLFSGWSTGFAFSAIVSQTPELAAIPPLAILYLSPFGIMELTAYSLAISRSFILVVLIIKKHNLSPAIRPTLIEVGIVVGLLLAGGFLEFYMIEMVQDTDFEMPGLS
ncbi:MAG: stage II sporulation protein M [Nitrosopumilaceae archaeon]|nr:stage II sporulation protein M [Nitrosopumilaceae archaeon]NIU00129.1 stage II sporulation protein M [Nitrosopumilaceae archaeon]NIU89139.1 stage II sporulation protein M [Nitrosopumilaceae archaeon]NIV65247.1 stage II sporulation protein M [Nitrosopumilaceae archaeon]NIX60731.1 stage II sporulation protein M [Nitrosopumilaceae archaeon]